MSVTFNSLQFVVFLAVVLVAYWASRPTWRLPILLASSWIFYAAWDARFLGLIVATTLVDFTVAHKMQPCAGRTRKAWLAVSVVANLGVLGYFKYAGFFVDSAARFLRGLGLDANLPALQVALPIGISFYTFQTLGYSIDVFRREIEPERNAMRFAVFVAFFPQLVAGPIERASAMLPQFAAHQRRPDARRIQSGLALIVVGLFKKVVLADQAALVVNDTYGAPAGHSSIDLAVGVVAFAVQVYMDFSAYTDIARGAARLFGIDLRRNFDTPYRSRNVQEFWRRWHVTLSTWLRDYLYRPLGGSRRTHLVTLRNLFITMLLGGLWHGAGSGFVLWGALHGAALCVHRVWTRRISWKLPFADRTLRAGAVAITVVFVFVALIPFRARSVGAARVYVSEMLTNGLTVTRPDHLWLTVVVVCAMLVHDRLRPEAHRLLTALRNEPLVAGVGVGAALGLLALHSARVAEPFIYFRF